MLFSKRQNKAAHGRTPAIRPPFRVHLQCELLEDRRLPSTMQLAIGLSDSPASPQPATAPTPGSGTGKIRVVTYNIEDDINGFTTPRPGLVEVLEGIGEEQVAGSFQPLDVLTLQETTSNSTTVAPIVSALNSYYGRIAVYAQSSY